MELSPFSHHNVSTAVVLMESAILRRPRVIELNVGTICASLPFLPAFHQRYRFKSSRVAALRTFTNRIKPFRSSGKMIEDRLETGMLESAQGECKFLESSDLTSCCDGGELCLVK